MQSTQPLLEVMKAITYCGLYGLICILFGAGLLRFVKIVPSKEMALSRTGYLSGAFFLGLGIFGALWQVIATLGFFSLNVVVPILLLAGLLGVPQFSSIMNLTFKGFKSVIKDTWSSGLIWIILGILLISLIALYSYLTLHPPNCDALAYYLAQEKLIACTHQVTPLPDDEILMLCHFGLNAEMHGAVMYLIGGDLVGEYAANMSVWVTAVVSGVMLWAISSRVGLGRIGQWSVMVMLFTSTAFTLVMWAGKTDLFSAGLGLAAVYWLLTLGKVKDWIALMLSGLMAGFAINSKMSYVVVMVPMLSALAILILNKNFTFKETNGISIGTSRIKYFTKAACIAGGAVLVAFLPLFFKNAIVFNEPLAPFVYLHMAGNTALDQVWFSAQNTRWIVLTYPIALTFGQYPMQFGNVSPLLLALAPAFLFFPKYLGISQNRLLPYLVISSLFGIAFWIILQPATLAPRYMLCPLLTLFPLGGFVVEKVWRQSGYLLLQCVMYFAMGAMLFCTYDGIQRPLLLAKHYCFGGSITPEDFQQQYQREIWKAFAIVNSKAQRGDKVCLVAYTRLPLRSDLLQSCLIDYSRLPLRSDRLQSIFSGNDASHPWEDIFNRGGRWIIMDRITHGKFNVFQSLIEMKNVPDFLSIISFPIGEHLIVYQIVPKK